MLCGVFIPLKSKNSSLWYIKEIVYPFGYTGCYLVVVLCLGSRWESSGCSAMYWASFWSRLIDGSWIGSQVGRSSTCHFTSTWVFDNVGFSFFFDKVFEIELEITRWLRIFSTTKNRASLRIPASRGSLPGLTVTTNGYVWGICIESYHPVI